MNILRFIKVLSIFVVFTTVLFGCLKNDSFKIDKNNNIILYQIKNYDKSIIDSLDLTLHQYKNLQNYIKKHYPDFKILVYKMAFNKC